MSVKIFAVRKDSYCYRKGIRGGDLLVSVNGNEINDVLDYRFYAEDNSLHLLFSKADGKHKKVNIRRISSVDDLGLEFETYLMDRQRSCKNKCIFCFIDQLPKGLRPSLYFKDDDSRLSFLFGNYITLTNLTPHDVQRIVNMHISPINVSVHTMDPDLRVKMMKNPHAGEVLTYLNDFSVAGIAINAQLVLCPGINDGDALRFSLDKLSELDSLQSIAAVPVGLTRYREGLFPLRKFTKNEALAVIKEIDAFNERRISAGKLKTAYPADEFFQLAELDFPPYVYYGDFPQLDNGVGLIVNTRFEFMNALNKLPADDKMRRFSVVTGKASYNLMVELTHAFCDKFLNSEIVVYCIENRFFGENVTVAGLLTGTDILQYFKNNKPKYKKLLFPRVMFKSDSELIFLDDISLADIGKELSVETYVADCSAESLLELFCNLNEE